MLKLLFLVVLRRLLLLLLLMKIFIVVLWIVVLGLHFERLLFEHLRSVGGPLHCLLVDGWVGVVHWWVPCGHGLSVDSELLLDTSLRVSSLTDHLTIVTVLHTVTIHLLGHNTLRCGHHWYHGLTRHQAGH